MPPTDTEEQLKEFYARLRVLMGKKPVEEAVQTIKNFCKLLPSYDVKNISADYDGSGDSGNMSLHVHTESVEPRLDDPGNNANIRDAIGPRSTTQNRYRPFHEFFADIINQPDALVTKKQIDDFENAMYELLPGGWEINDGSYGEISVDVATGEINVEHSERIIDINHSSHTY